MTKQQAFTLVEMVISLALFSLAMLIAIRSIIGSTGLVHQADIRSQLGESARGIQEQMERMTGDVPVGAIGLLQSGSNTYGIWSRRVLQIPRSDVGIRRVDTCEYLGRASSVTSPGETDYIIDPVGKSIGYWIMELSDNQSCTDAAVVPANASIHPKFQNQLISKDIIGLNFNAQLAAYGSLQLLKYQYTLQMTISQTGGTAEAAHPTISISSGLPIGLLQ